MWFNWVLRLSNLFSKDDCIFAKVELRLLNKYIKLSFLKLLKEITSFNTSFEIMNVHECWLQGDKIHNLYDLIAIENKCIFIDTLDAHIVYNFHQFMEFNFYRFLEIYSAEVQPRLIQGIRRGDGVGDLFIYLFIQRYKE